ncbi:MAG: DUF7901 domain-containing protein [Planctomycetota bacterium]|jgi:hypothetical protein
MKKLMFVLCVMALTAVVSASPYMSAIPGEDWADLLIPGPDENLVTELIPADGEIYSQWWQDNLEDGDPYMEANWEMPELYVYEGDDDPDDPDNHPDDEGLIMTWGAGEPPSDENFSAGWVMVYGIDPDLTNCTININVLPPTWINAVSFWLTDINGNQVAWNWIVPGAGIPHNVSTPIKIDTSKLALGMNATNPPANGFASGPGVFDISKVVSFGVSENAFQYPGNTIPPAGTQATNQAWNAWSNLWVINNATKAYKGNYVKFSQPPEVIEPNIPPQIYGWDVQSVMPFNFDQGMTWTWAADDWVCEDERPITDVHWWGSFIGWTQPHLPPVVPDYFVMAIWKDVPADAATSSHPKELLWRHECHKWVSNFAGYDVDPRFEYVDYDQDLFGLPQESEACFQFNQLLDEEDYFYQEPMADDGTTPNIYWFSIAAVYNGVDDVSQIQYPWGWKSKPYDPNKAPDPAVVITDLDPGTPPWETVSGTTTPHITEVQTWFPIILPDPSLYPGGDWWDLAFELTTNEPKCPGLTADLNEDCIVSLPDFAIMAQEWLMTSP